MGWSSFITNLFHGKIRSHVSGRKWEYSATKGVWKIKENSNNVSSLLGPPGPQGGTGPQGPAGSVSNNVSGDFTVSNGSLLINTFNVNQVDEGLFFREGFTNSDKYNLSIFPYDHNGGGTGHTDGISINGYDGVSICTGSNARQERMRIKGNGNVGIGTSSPSEKLDVAGTVKATAFVGKGAGNQYTYSETVSRASNAPEEWYKVWSSGGGSLSFDIQIEVGGDNTACMDRFTVALSSYGMPANIVRYPGTKYNASKLLEIITVGPIGSFLFRGNAREVWVRVASMDPSDYTGADAGFLTVRSNQGGVIPLANPQVSKPAQYSPDASLVVTAYTRSAYSLSTSGGIEVGGYITAPNQPSFQVYYPAKSGQDVLIKWSGVRSNVGNHYSTSTGLFTAPIAGVYHFDFSVLMGNPHSSSYVRVLWKINGSNSTTYGDTLADRGSHGSYTNCGMGLTITLSGGDTVGVWNDGPIQTYGTNYGNFSGHLIG